MTVRLHDSQTQALRDFAPLEAGNVTMYVCGPTVQSGPHIGHLRGALAFDILRRWLVHRFGRVTFVRNVTDIDDKVLANATADEPWWALAYRMELEFTAAYSAIGILPPTYEPRATASIPQMVELIERLIAAGHAYAAPDGSGDVYFDVRSWSAYGSLTRQALDAMEAAADADPRGKRDRHDFALWKGAKPDEPDSAIWDAPWGAGRPGWHIECSAMSRRYLGPTFDIHGGGLDLRFPHHENELAQSAAAGDAFAQLWVHNGLVTVDGQKMSKSLGNFVLARDVLTRRDPLAVRYALAAAHYRSSLDVSDQAFDEAEAALERVQGYAARVQERLADHADALAAAVTVPAEFAAAMDDDLNTPVALAVLHEHVRRGNAALADGGDVAAQIATYGAVVAMLHALGLTRAAEGWADPTFGRADGAASFAGARARREHEALGAFANGMIAERARARLAKDWAEADRIRDAAREIGIAFTDTPDGTVWSLDD